MGHQGVTRSSQQRRRVRCEDSEDSKKNTQHCGMNTTNNVCHVKFSRVPGGLNQRRVSDFLNFPPGVKRRHFGEIFFSREKRRRRSDQESPSVTSSQEFFQRSPPTDRGLFFFSSSCTNEFPLNVTLLRPAPHSPSH